MIFYSFAQGPEGGIYYDAQPIEQMSYQLTMLAYDMNDEPVSFGHGAPAAAAQRDPARLQDGQMDQGHRVCRDFSEVGGGLGGYNNDHEFFGYRQSI